MALHFTQRVLCKYEVGYHLCRSCGLLQTEEPHWLDEAYKVAIAELDTGLLQRNLRLSRLVARVLFFAFDRNGAFVDIGGGLGLFTRLLRDTGFDFRWSDKYASNLLARGFEARPGRPHEAITAFEVLEHVRDPVGFLGEALALWKARSVLFTTELYVGEPPQPEAWWYYAFETGQHVSFYSVRTLELIASQLGLHFHSHGGLHLLTDRPIGALTYRFLTGKPSEVVGPYVARQMRSRTWSDFEALRRPRTEAGDG
jgi:hypothetical protein